MSERLESVALGAVGLSVAQMAARVVREFREGMVVNLGAGLPYQCLSALDPQKEILLHAEQGVLGFGPVAPSIESADPYLLNANRQCVLRKPGMAILDHAESFALARGGRIDLSVMGALEVSQRGDLASYRLAGRPSGMMGGAQDFAFCARRVIVLMRSRTTSGQPKLVRECALPLTAPEAVDLVVSEIGVFEIQRGEFLLKEIAQGLTPAEVASVVAGKLNVAMPLAEVSV